MELLAVLCLLRLLKMACLLWDHRLKAILALRLCGPDGTADFAFHSKALSSSIWFEMSP
ncbi:hypothetical protein SAMN05216228_10862 [Rhizobium tibeticum]|uniref:Uncharacterized protein n=1 Tax=Rhizobium tibeticum TaxID=501024 RepID=A0A1H8WYL4_9HYPH|nr:hypothetical protein [Rhizobium tibeticum]SEI21723.1 hypothetical protein RTCCBAU85039_6713 [Rhizobium tibeticum]SEP32754.1 hypothetical protein SAMN05216228_10862 [Rhizobium tibeticum]